jgi:hypothetical protein
MVPNPINSRSTDSVDMFIGRDWIAAARIKFRQASANRGFSALLIRIWPIFVDLQD